MLTAFKVEGKLVCKLCACEMKYLEDGTVKHINDKEESKCFQYYPQYENDLTTLHTALNNTNSIKEVHIENISSLDTEIKQKYEETLKTLFLNYDDIKKTHFYELYENNVILSDLVAVSKENKLICFELIKTEDKAREFYYKSILLSLIGCYVCWVAPRLFTRPQGGTVYSTIRKYNYGNMVEVNDGIIKVSNQTKSFEIVNFNEFELSKVYRSKQYNMYANLNMFLNKSFTKTNKGKGYL